MSKKKKQYYTSDDDKIIAEEFDHAIRFIKKSFGGSSAVKRHDLAGTILKRRKEATFVSLDEIRERYGEKYPELELPMEWAQQNCAIGYSVESVDGIYYTTIATAIWMLDALKQGYRMKDAITYLPTDDDELSSVDLPVGLFDPCHEESVIRGMALLIQNRDLKGNNSQCYINDITASNRPLSSKKAPGKNEPVQTSYREQFDAVMEMIHPVLKERAKKRYEAKLWEFLDIYFSCASRYVAEREAYRRKNDQLWKECDELFADIQGQNQLQSGPLFPQKVPNMPSQNVWGDTVLSLGIRHSTDPSKKSKFEALENLTNKGLLCESKIEELDLKRASLLHMAHMVSVRGQDEIEEHLDPDTADQLLQFTVEDPYEICFASY